MTRPGPAACTQAAPGSWSGSGRGAGQEKTIVTNPSLTKGANRRRDDSLVTDLVTRARNGDRQARNALVERYAPLIWSICRRHRLGDADAEDVGQSVWLKLVDQLGTLRDGDPDRGHRRHPDRPGRSSHRSPSAAGPAISLAVRMTDPSGMHLRTGAPAPWQSGRPCRRQIRAFSVPAGHPWSCKLPEPIAMCRAGSAVVCVAEGLSR